MIKTVLHPVSDLEAAKPVYTALLGVQPQADSSYYVGFDAEGQHIGLVPSGGPQRPSRARSRPARTRCRTDRPRRTGAFRPRPG